MKAESWLGATGSAASKATTTLTPGSLLVEQLGPDVIPAAIVSNLNRYATLRMARL
jgi:hypothetical protein